MIKQFTRTFHPVGQGAFYTEKIITEAKPEGYNVVYDCGSITWKSNSRAKGDKLQKYINNTFRKDEVVDLLFISHFHYDHINGLEFLRDRCQIKKVIMPLLDSETKILARISLMLENGDTSIIDDPQSYFGNRTQITQVDSVSESENNLDPRTYTIESLDGENTIKSGDKIKIDIDWYYIPFNYQLRKRKLEFMKALKNPSINLTLADIDSADKVVRLMTEKGSDGKKTKRIERAYEEVNSELNLHSLVLYSGNKETIIDLYNGNPCYFFRYLGELFSGCLYLGDIDLNQANIIDNIKARLSNFWNIIGIIQLPHHGSIENFNDSILSSSMKFGILSYGTTNGYGHPSSSVQASLLLQNIYPLHVTEILNSIIIQLKR